MNPMLHGISNQSLQIYRRTIGPAGRLPVRPGKAKGGNRDLPPASSPDLNQPDSNARAAIRAGSTQHQEQPLVEPQLMQR